MNVGGLGKILEVNGEGSLKGRKASPLLLTCKHIHMNNDETGILSSKYNTQHQASTDFFTVVLLLLLRGLFK